MKPLELKCDNLAEIIRKSGYVFIRGRDFRISSALLLEWHRLQKTWEDLSPDRYIRSPVCYRFRRHSSFSYRPEERRISPLPTTFFLQSEKVNALYGGIKRDLAPLHPDSLQSPFIRHLIQFNFAQFPISHEMRLGQWVVGIHQIRIVGWDKQPGLPTPEGVHRDGHDFVAMHFIAKRNVLGCVSTVYDTAGCPLKEIEMEQPLDSLYVDDARVMHAVTPVVPTNPLHPGSRDVLLVTYNYDGDG